MHRKLLMSTVISGVSAPHPTPVPCPPSPSPVPRPHLSVPSSLISGRPTVANTSMLVHLTSGDGCWRFWPTVAANFPVLLNTAARTHVSVHGSHLVF